MGRVSLNNNLGRLSIVYNLSYSEFTIKLYYIINIFTY